MTHLFLKLLLLCCVYPSQRCNECFVSLLWKLKAVKKEKSGFEASEVMMLEFLDFVEYMCKKHYVTELFMQNDRVAIRVKAITI